MGGRQIDGCRAPERGGQRSYPVGGDGPGHRPARRRARVTGSVGLGLGAAVAVFGAGAAGASGHPCGGITATQVDAALGTRVGSPKVVTNGSVSECTFADHGGPATTIVRVQTGVSPQAWTASRSQFDKHGEPTVTVTGLANRAYSSSLGSGRYLYSTIVVLKGRTELLVTAPVALAKVEALARRALPGL